MEDIQKSRRLYEEVLGQSVKADYGENVVFHGDFAIHQRKHYQALINNSSISTRSNSFELYFEDDDLVSVVDKAKAAGLEFIHNIIEQPWKQRVVRFYDYDKNIVEVGERMEHVAYRLTTQGMSIAEVSKVTYLPQQAVEAALVEYGSRASAHH